MLATFSRHPAPAKLNRWPFFIFTFDRSSFTPSRSRSQDMEDFNVPTAERVDLLKQLQEAMGGVPPYFWAACQICDLKALEDFIELARRFPAHACIIAAQTYTMVLHCK
jgi:hypothetical protein